MWNMYCDMVLLKRWVVEYIDKFMSKCISRNEQISEWSKHESVWESAESTKRSDKPISEEDWGLSSQRMNQTTRWWIEVQERKGQQRIGWYIIEKMFLAHCTIGLKKTAATIKDRENWNFLLQLSKLRDTFNFAVTLAAISIRLTTGADASGSLKHRYTGWNFRRRRN